MGVLRPRKRATKRSRSISRGSIPVASNSVRDTQAAEAAGIDEAQFPS